MKRILVISDDHGYSEKFLPLLLDASFDLKIHLGDSELSKNELVEHYDYFVLGNNDWGDIMKEQSFTYEGISFFICHGHTKSINMINYKSRCNDLSNSLSEDVFLFGHTHIPFVEKINNKYFACPGSISLSRSGPNSYLIITIENNNVDFEIVPL